VSPAAVGLDLSSGAPASVIAWRRMRCSWPGCPPRSGTRCGIRNKATQRGSRLTQQLALIRLPRMLRNVAAASRDELRRAREATPQRRPPAAWTPAWDVALDAEQDHLHRGPSAIRAASSARDRHSPANVSCSSA